MINPVQPNTQSTMIPIDAFPGQKLERFQDTPRKVVDRKQETPSAREEIPREQVERVTEKLNRQMGIMGKSLKFKVHEKSNRIVVKIIDQESGEVVDEIPPKRVLDILSSFTQMTGLMFDEPV